MTGISEHQHIGTTQFKAHHRLFDCQDFYFNHLLNYLQKIFTVVTSRHPSSIAASIMNTILVTGATSGIGRACCKLFAARVACWCPSSSTGRAASRIASEQRPPSAPRSRPRHAHEVKPAPPVAPRAEPRRSLGDGFRRRHSLGLRRSAAGRRGRVRRARRPIPYI